MNKGEWEKIDKGNLWQIICPHPSGRGRQNLGFFRKADLTPIVNLIVAAPVQNQALQEIEAFVKHNRFIGADERTILLSKTTPALAKADGKELK